MVRIKLMDGSSLEIPRDEALELLPFRGVFVSAMLRHPIEGIVTHRGKLLPVLGPLPAEPTEHLPVEERAWLLRMKGCAQVVRGLPVFDAAAATEVAPLSGTGEENGALLQELDELLKAS